MFSAAAAQADADEAASRPPSQWPPPTPAFDAGRIPVMAALLAAGMAAVKNREKLHVRGVKVAPSEMKEQERERAGIS